MSNTTFTFNPAPWVPFKDKEVLERCRNLTREELVQHPNPDFKINIVLATEGLFVADMVARMMKSDIEDKPCVMIIPNPWPSAYQAVAHMVNNMRINCRNVHIFPMDEWADDQGNIAPLTYQSGFSYSFMKYFYNQIDPELRMPLENIHYPTTENIKYYSDMIDECGEGGADAIYAGPGWAGHIAFIDPCPELIPGFCDGGKYIIKDLDDPYFQQPAQVVTLHPLTIMQNSLHGVFGQSGDIANVPPKAATIGPRDVLHAKKRIECHSLATYGTFSSWQRMTSRLITHGPVTPYVPGSIFQLLDTDLYMDPIIAQPIEVMETAGY